MVSAAIAFAIFVEAAGAPIGCHQTSSNLPVRSSDPRLAGLVLEGISTSPTFTGLVDQIRVSRAIVYIEWTQSLDRRVEGALLTHVVITPDGTRFFRVIVRRRPPTRWLIPLLAHELQHVIEALGGNAIIGNAGRGLPPSTHVLDTEAATQVQHQVEQELKRASPR
jgi:hypothetical protein